MCKVKRCDFLDSPSSSKQTTCKRELFILHSLGTIENVAFGNSSLSAEASYVVQEIQGHLQSLTYKVFLNSCSTVEMVLLQSSPDLRQNLTVLELIHKR